MKRSALLISLSALAHLCVIDIIFLMVTKELVIEDASMNSLVVLSYNAVWLLMVMSIWNHSYKENRSN